MIRLVFLLVKFSVIFIAKRVIEPFKKVDLARLVKEFPKRRRRKK